MPYDLDALPKSLLTMGTHNAKTAKSEGGDYIGAILHLAPERLSGRNVCPHASAGCREACLNTAGRGGMVFDADGLNDIQAARIQRTRWFHRDRRAFLSKLVREIASFERRAIRRGLTPTVRLNGTSDLPWERFPVERDGKRYSHVFAAFPGIVFYDYTKWPPRLRERARAIPNYSLTFSLAEDNDRHAADALKRGMNVAVVFDIETARAGFKPQPAAPMIDSFKLGTSSYPVIDGDRTDLRFLDPRGGHIVGLRAKGRGKRDRTGFVRAAA